MSDEWMQRAACKGMDPEIFFPEAAHGPAGDEARAVCETCPVRVQCLEYALANVEPDGIWGGKTWRQRRKIRSDRRRIARGLQPKSLG